MEDETELNGRVIIVSAPVSVDPALILFSAGVEVRRGDELRVATTDGNAGVRVVGEADRAG